MTHRYRPGSLIERREVMQGNLWLAHDVTVVADDGTELAVLLEPGSHFRFPAHPFGPHPWSDRDGWDGPTVLQVHRDGDRYSVWKFFEPSPEGWEFVTWYVNFEAPMVRQEGGFATDDQELDLVISPDGTRQWKDVESMATMVEIGRLTPDEVVDVLDAGREVWRLLEADDRWWSEWDDWTPARVGR